MSTISRRDVLKKSAVAGAVFWSVPVIESVTAKAAAQSNCINNTTFTASYAWVVFSVTNGSTTTVYFTGIKPGGTFDQGSSDGPACIVCNNVAYNDLGFNGIGRAKITYGGSSCPSPDTTDLANQATYAGDATNPHSLINGQEVSNFLAVTSQGGNVATVSAVPGTGTNLLAVFYFPNGTVGLQGACGNGSQPFCGNFV